MHVSTALYRLLSKSAFVSRNTDRGVFFAEVHRYAIARLLNFLSFSLAIRFANPIMKLEILSAYTSSTAMYSTRGDDVPCCNADGLCKSFNEQRAYQKDCLRLVDAGVRETEVTSEANGNKKLVDAEHELSKPDVVATIDWDAFKLVAMPHNGQVKPVFTLSGTMPLLQEHRQPPVEFPSNILHGNLTSSTYQRIARCSSPSSVDCQALNHVAMLTGSTESITDIGPALAGPYPAYLLHGDNGSQGIHVLPIVSIDPDQCRSCSMSCRCPAELKQHVADVHFNPPDVLTNAGSSR